jgi:hypothetical protein
MKGPAKLIPILKPGINSQPATPIHLAEASQRRRKLPSEGWFVGYNDLVESLSH